jgi:hypothetical protein
MARSLPTVVTNATVVARRDARIDVHSLLNGPVTRAHPFRLG